MNKTNKLELTLDSDAFAGLKLDFKQILNSTLNTMLNKDVDEAEIGIKLSIELEDGYGPDPEITAYEAERNITMPKFKHKVTGSMKVKSEKSGSVGGKDHYLTWDKDAGAFVMIEVTATAAQKSLFDEEDEGTEDDDKTEPVSDDTEIPAGAVLPVDLMTGDTIYDETDQELFDGGDAPEDAAGQDDLPVYGESQESGYDDTAPADPEFAEAIKIVREAGFASASLLQRQMKIGYKKAAGLIDKLEAADIIGPFNGSAPREVLPEQPIDGVPFEDPSADEGEPY